MTEPIPAKHHLRAYFHLSHMPFSKYAWAKQMFDSAGQRELGHALSCWTEVRGIALVTGASGVGKSISIRRFLGELDRDRFQVCDFTYLPTTVTGFLRMLSRQLGLPMRQYTADLFDQVRSHLAAHDAADGAHPLVVIDDAEGLSPAVLDTVRRLASRETDAEEPFSLLLSGTDELLTLLRHPSLASLRTRIFYAQQLRAFGLEDTRNYVRYHLTRADADPKLFSEEAVRRIFQASQGRPRSINQLALQAMIQAAVNGRDHVDGDFMKHIVETHPLYEVPGAAA